MSAGKKPLLTAAQCEEQRRAFARGERWRTLRRMARDAGVAYNTMRRIVNGPPYVNRCRLDEMAG